MNIFRVDNDPKAAARSLCDKHIVKMSLETAQLLCTALRTHGFDASYRATHVRHPCTLWCSQTRGNFEWLVDHGLSLCDEYTYRYGKTHKCQAIIELAANNATVIPDGEETEQPQCMPDDCKGPDVVTAYRTYYRYKMGVIKMAWRVRERPDWMERWAEHTLSSGVE